MILISDGKIRFSVKITFIFCLFVSVIVISYTQKQYFTYKQERCMLMGETASHLFQDDVEKNLTANQILEALILENNGRVNNFKAVARKLINRYPSIQSIHLAPKGLITQNYPKSYSDKQINLFDFSETKISSNYALKTKNTYLTGPLLGENNTSELLIQHPVFIADSDGNESFWGFIILSLSTSNLFDKEHLDFLNNAGYRFRIWKPEPVNEDPFVFYENTTLPLSNPCTNIFGIANSLWTVYTQPQEGWFNTGILIIEIISALTFSLLASFTIAFLVSLKNRDEALERLSFRDSLTNLYNTRKFMNTLKEYAKSGEPYSIIYLDINDFKQINDNLGHDTGDQVLVIAARKISNCIREGDRAFRIGGDEFTVILPGKHEGPFVEAVIERIKESIKRETVLRNARLQITSSAGFARCPEDSSDYEEVIKTADKNMYLDKQKLKQTNPNGLSIEKTGNQDKK